MGIGIVKKVDKKYSLRGGFIKSQKWFDHFFFMPSTTERVITYHRS